MTYKSSMQEQDESGCRYCGVSIGNAELVELNGFCEQCAFDQEVQDDFESEDQSMSNTQQQLIEEAVKRFQDKYNSFELCEVVRKQDHDNLIDFLKSELSLIARKSGEKAFDYGYQCGFNKLDYRKIKDNLENELELEANPKEL